MRVTSRADDPGGGGPTVRVGSWQGDHPAAPRYRNDKTWYTTNAGQTTDFITAKTTSQNVPE